MSVEFFRQPENKKSSNQKLLYYKMNLMEVDDGGRWNIVDNTYILYNIYIYKREREILSMIICETWPSIPVVSVKL